MNARSLSVKLVLVALLGALPAPLQAQDGLKGALSQTSLAAPLERTLAIADVDGDDKADGAVLFSSRWLGHYNNFTIQLHFTGRPNTELTFQSSERALTLTAWDIDHDGDIDLVVEEAFTHKPVFVWVNEGHGDFHEGRIQDYPSLAPAVVTRLEAPANQRDCPALSLPSQRSFEKAVLTVPQFGRPPSANDSQFFATTAAAVSHTGTQNSSRAPPLA